jgi:hypothetical protein
MEDASAICMVDSDATSLQLRHRESLHFPDLFCSMGLPVGSTSGSRMRKRQNQSLDRTQPVAVSETLPML